MARIDLNRPPTARYIHRAPGALLAALLVGLFTTWALWHAAATVRAFTGHGSPLALTFTATFLLMWWVPLSWFERPAGERPRHGPHSRRGSGKPVVTVQIPVYNEDPATLRACLRSLLAQTRLPDKVLLVDDGSSVDYTQVKAWWLHAAAQAGIFRTWQRTENRGKRHAQMHVLAHDDADIYVTLDCDSVLDPRAIEEGLKPFRDTRVTSVAGMVVVWNMRRNALTYLTCLLYTPFTRGFRSAQSMLGRVMVNSGTLAFLRADIVRKYAGSYENEQFRGRPMQMNDDSMLTFYALLEGRAVHQPSSIAFTIVPEGFSHYARQQMRWMRGTFIRTLWWFRYLPVSDAAWWMPLFELVQIFMSVAVALAVALGKPQGVSWWDLASSTVLVGLGLNYLVSLRYFCVRRSDEPWWLALAVFLAAPLAGAWRFLILRPMVLFAMATCWRIQSWGTRAQVEVSLG
jgi:hyaluronan synthase